MWIKTKDGRLHDTTGCTIEQLPIAKQEPMMAVVMSLRNGKHVMLVESTTEELAAQTMQFIENALANGRLLVELP